MTNANPEPLAYSIADAARVMSLGTTRIRELIAEGELTPAKIGKRTLVRADSLRALLDRCSA